MRHNEANARLAVGQTLDVISHYKAMLAARDKRIEELEGTFFEVMAMYEKLQSMQHERELELAKVARDEKNQDFMREQFGVLAPVVLQKVVGGLTGGKGGAPSPILGEELLMRFLGSLSDEQRSAILSKLTLQQQIALQEIYMAYGKRAVDREKEKSEKSKKKNGSNGATNGSAGH
jgi:hypothetical protein